jgi:hypothetical protein
MSLSERNPYEVHAELVQRVEHLEQHMGACGHTLAPGSPRWLEAEVRRLQAQTVELHRQINYIRGVVWDDSNDDAPPSTAEQIVAVLRDLLDRPKWLDY